MCTFVQSSVVDTMGIIPELKLKKELSGRQKRRKKRQQETQPIHSIPLEVIIETSGVSSEPEKKLRKEKLSRRFKKSENALGYSHPSTQRSILNLFSSIKNFLRSRETQLVTREKLRKSKINDSWLKRVKPLTKEKARQFKLKKQTIRTPSKKPSTQPKKQQAEILQRKNPFKRFEAAPPLSYYDTHFNHWKKDLKIDAEHSAVKIAVIDTFNNKFVPAFLEITTSSGYVEVPKETTKIWHQTDNVYTFKRNQILNIKAHGGYEFEVNENYVYLNEAYQTITLKLSRWLDISKSVWKPHFFSTQIRPITSSIRAIPWTNLVSKISRLHGLGVEHPLSIHLNKTKYQLPYEAFYEMCLNQEITWIPIQHYDLHGIHFSLWGSSDLFALTPSQSAIQQSFALFKKAKKNKALVCIHSPSTKIQERSLLPMLLQANLIPDLLDLQSPHDFELYYSLLKLGYRIPFVCHEQIKLKEHIFMANHLLDSHNNASLAAKLNSLRSGKILIGKNFQMDFYLRNKQGETFRVAQEVPSDNDGSLLTPLLNFSVQSQYGKIKYMELIINGLAIQKTKLKTPLHQGEAIFGDLLLHPGDTILIHLVKSNQEHIYSNPIYIGSPQIPSYQNKRPVKLSLLDLDSQLLQDDVTLIARGYRFFTEKRIQGGQKELLLPNDCILEFWTESYPVQRVQLLDYLNSLYQEDSFNGLTLNECIERIQSHTISIQVQFNET